MHNFRIWGFLDKPAVDKYSINSEASERRLVKFLNQGSGFICRKDTPDKGIDYDIELITEGIMPPTGGSACN